MCIMYTMTTNMHFEGQYTCQVSQHFELSLYIIRKVVTTLIYTVLRTDVFLIKVFVVLIATDLRGYPWSIF